MLKSSIILNRNNNFPLDRYEIINKYKGNCVNFIMGNCDGNCNLIHSIPIRKEYVMTLENSIKNKTLGKDSKQIKDEFKGFCSEFIVSNCTNTNCKFYHSDKLKEEFNKNRNPCYCSYYLKFGNCRIDWCKYIHDNTAYENYKTNLANAKKELEQFRERNIEPNYCVFWENKCCSDTKCKFNHTQKIKPQKFYSTVLKTETPIKQPIREQNNDLFVGVNWSTNTMLCKKFNCDCSKHNMYNQSQSNVGLTFDNFIKTKKIPLIELTMKLNKIYYDNFLYIQSQLTKNNLLGQIDFPNNKLNLESLEKLFSVIDNNKIYENNLTQTEYSILYEIFRRSKHCPKYKCFSEGIIYDSVNKPNYCYYGRNCIKGHHGFNGICHDDLYYNKCSCKNNLEEINKLKEEIDIVENETKSDDGFIEVNEQENKKTKIKYIKRKIDQLESTILLHLNRDNYCTDVVHTRNVTQNFKMEFNNNTYLLKMEQVKTSDDYNNYIINQPDKPLCYSVYQNTKSDFSVDHKWSKDLWNEYINYTVTENNLPYRLCLYFTFSNFQNLLKTILPIYTNSLNTEKDWTQFLINYNNKIKLWNECFKDKDAVVIDTEYNIYVNKNSYLLNDKLNDKFNDFEKKIINDNNYLLKSYLNNYDIPFTDWLINKYGEEIITTNDIKKVLKTNTINSDKIDIDSDKMDIDSISDNDSSSDISDDDFISVMYDVNSTSDDSNINIDDSNINIDDSNNVDVNIDSNNLNVINSDKINYNNEFEYDFNLDKSYDLDNETIILDDTQKYFLSKDLLVGPLKGPEFMILKKRIRGIVTFTKKTVNNIQVGSVQIKSTVPVNLINIICEALNIKYTELNNTSDYKFLINHKLF